LFVGEDRFAGHAWSLRPHGGKAPAEQEPCRRLRQALSGVHTAEVDHFVGRTGELAVLDAEMRAVRGGRPRAVLGEQAVSRSAGTTR
jgi:hypothetical protein